METATVSSRRTEEPGYAVPLVATADAGAAAGSARIAITGDFCPWGLEVSPAQGRGGPSAGEVLAGLRSVATTSDMTVVNLECPLHRGDPIRKSGPTLAADAAWATVLKDAGADVVSLANNHILDQGPAGLRATVRACADAGLRTVGAADDIAEAARPLLLEVGGVHIALVAVAEHEFATAGASSCGAAPAEPMAAFRAIRDARERADVVVVLFHGGREQLPLPPPRQLELARFFVDAGAHVVACHHSHVVGPAEWYHGCPIVYGLGNLMFPDGGTGRGPDWFESSVLLVDLDPSGAVAAQLVGLRYDAGQGTVSVLGEAGTDALAQRLSQLHAALADPAEIRRRWLEHVMDERTGYLSAALGLSRVERFFVRRGAWPFWRMPHDRLPAMLNAVRCESHQEALVAVLEEEL
jgi:poly-gamma-glutamate capsule biosynthesis protein CapA/YwtB (metallophosphatase superfamily)